MVELAAVYSGSHWLFTALCSMNVFGGASADSQGSRKQCLKTTGSGSFLRTCFVPCSPDDRDCVGMHKSHYNAGFCLVLPMVSTDLISVLGPVRLSIAFSETSDKKSTQSGLNRKQILIAPGTVIGIER